MFEVKPYKPIIRNLHKIVANRTVLFNDGYNDVLYSGSNEFGNRVLGVVMYEDEDEGVVRYLHHPYTLPCSQGLTK